LSFSEGGRKNPSRSLLKPGGMRAPSPLYAVLKVADVERRFLQVSASMSSVDLKFATDFTSFSEADLSELGQSLASTDNELVKLDLWHTGICNNVIVDSFLLHGLIGHTALRILDLGDNRLGDGCVRSICTALASGMICPFLEDLNLEKNGITECIDLALASVITSPSRLQRLELKDNALGNVVAGHLANALKHNTTLSYLGLYHNAIGTKGASVLLECLVENEGTALQLDLRCNLVASTRTMSQIAAICHRNAEGAGFVPMKSQPHTPPRQTHLSPPTEAIPLILSPRAGSENKVASSPEKTASVASLFPQPSSTSPPHIAGKKVSGSKTVSETDGTVVKPLAVKPLKPLKPLKPPKEVEILSVAVSAQVEMHPVGVGTEDGDRKGVTVEVQATMSMDDRGMNTSPDNSAALLEEQLAMKAARMREVQQVLKQRLQEVGGRERLLVERYQEADRMEEALQLRQLELSELEETKSLERSQKLRDLAAEAQSVELRKSELHALERRVANDRKLIEEERKAVEARREELEDDMRDCDAAVQQAAAKEVALEEEKLGLQSQWTALAEREETLNAREKALEATEKAQEDQLTVISSREAALLERALALSKLNRDVMERHQDITARHLQLQKKETQLTLDSIYLGQMREGLASMEQTLGGELDKLDSTLTLPVDYSTLNDSVLSNSTVHSSKQ
jgi:hypothetical protein